MYHKNTVVVEDVRSDAVLVSFGWVTGDCRSRRVSKALNNA